MVVQGYCGRQAVERPSWRACSRFSPSGVTIWSSISPLLHQCSEGVFDGAQPTPQLGGFLLLFGCPAILLIARETDAGSERAAGGTVKVGALTPGTEELRRFHAAPDDVGFGS
jgi:hypothetical protein